MKEKYVYLSDYNTYEEIEYDGTKESISDWFGCIENIPDNLEIFKLEKVAYTSKDFNLIIK